MSLTLEIAVEADEVFGEDFETDYDRKSIRSNLLLKGVWQVKASVSGIDPMVANVGEEQVFLG